MPRRQPLIWAQLPREASPHAPGPWARFPLERTLPRQSAADDRHGASASKSKEGAGGGARVLSPLAGAELAHRDLGNVLQLVLALGTERADLSEAGFGPQPTPMAAPNLPPQPWGPLLAEIGPETHAALVAESTLLLALLDLRSQPGPSEPSFVAMGRTPLRSGDPRTLLLRLDLNTEGWLERGLQALLR